MRPLHVEIIQSTRWCLLDICLYFIVQNKKKKGSLSIVSFVDKVNLPFAPNVELSGSDVGWENVLSALSQNRFICLNVSSHTLLWDANIAQDRVGNTSCQMTCTGVHSHAYLCSHFLQISFYSGWGMHFILGLGATINTPHLQTANRAGTPDIL